MRLLPCPFCGAKARFIERKCDQTKYGVGCSNIECILFLPPDVRKRELHNYVTCYVDRDTMIEAWNRREWVNTDEDKRLIADYMNWKWCRLRERYTRVINGEREVIHWDRNDAARCANKMWVNPDIVKHCNIDQFFNDMAEWLRSKK